MKPPIEYRPKKSRTGGITPQATGGARVKKTGDAVPAPKPKTSGQSPEPPDLSKTASKPPTESELEGGVDAFSAWAELARLRKLHAERMARYRAKLKTGKK